MGDVFKALADPTRRAILDELAERDGQTLFELCSRLATKHGLGSTRQAISQHLDVLEVAGLLRTHRDGRYKFHHLDTAPLRQVVERWSIPTLEVSDEDQPDECSCRRPSQGVALLHGGARVREEDRDSPR
ncbi:MAG: metalloregulator ArsR/SmtB family transcription factor [Actinomycetota bacterium]|nr:metalloregulator ArsR/SmtB family transcription factor [Actinomycetota bacterium]